ncbi:MAG: EamA family transporter [Alphaproteobacteria bacterium]|nr:EamA family transporter [Alphaproteobacteria bacterium]
MPIERKSLLVLFWMSGTLVSFVGVALSVRGLHDEMTTFEILAVRNIGGLVILAGMMLLAPGPDQVVRMVRPEIYLLRNVAHFAGQALWVWAVTVLPLATVFALEFTTPAWVALFAVLFLNERMTLLRGVAVVLGFLGVVIILRPGLDSFRPEALAVVLAAVFFGIQITTTKLLTGSNSTWSIMFWMNLMQLPMNAAANWAAGGSPLIVDNIVWSIWVPVLGITGFLAHYCFTNAFRHGDATLVVPIDFLRVPLIALIGWLFYAEVPELPVLIGALVVIGGVIVNLAAEARSKQTNS